MWPNLQETADLVTFTEEILNGKLLFLGSETYFKKIHKIHNRTPAAYIFFFKLEACNLI